MTYPLPVADVTCPGGGSISSAGALKVANDSRYPDENRAAGFAANVTLRKGSGSGGSTDLFGGIFPPELLVLGGTQPSLPLLHDKLDVSAADNKKNNPVHHIHRKYSPPTSSVSVESPTPPQPGRSLSPNHPRHAADVSTPGRSDSADTATRSAHTTADEVPGRRDSPDGSRPRSLAPAGRMGLAVSVRTVGSAVA